MDVRNIANQPITTAFPIRETIKDWKPGAYFVVMWNAARPIASGDDDDDSDDNRQDAAGMWVVDTDIALTSFTGGDGLNVFARSLGSARPLAGLELVLLNRGNEAIATATTTADGRATFAAGLLKGRGAAEPMAVMASPAVTGDFLTHDITTLVMAALHGQGLVFAPLPLVLPLFRTGALRPVLPECVSQPARIYIHYVSRKQLPARVKAFVNFMLQHLRRNPDLTSDPQALLAPFVGNPRPFRRRPSP